MTLQAESDQIGPESIAAAIVIVAVLFGKYLAVMLLIGNISVDRSPGATTAPSSAAAREPAATEATRAL